jgi:hypothetical protein
MTEPDAGASVPTVKPVRGTDGFYDLLPDVTCLPVRVAWKPQNALGIVLLLLLIGVVCAAKDDVADAFRTDGVSGLLVAPGVWVLVVVAIIVRALTLRLHWTFYADRVEFEKRGLLRRRTWTEPLTAYRGIATGRRKKARERLPLHVLTLTHADSRRRNVVLYKSPSPAGMRQARARFVRLFGLPLLVEAESGLEERAPDDVDRTVRQRAVAGTLADSFDLTGRPPGRRLTVAVEGDTLVLRVRRGLGMTGVAVPAVLFAFWAVLDAIAWAPGVSPVAGMRSSCPLPPALWLPWG